MKSPVNHCSDEQLLAFLDGELELREERTVRSHLARCWQCRGTMGDIDARAQNLAELVNDTSFLGPERIRLAKERFLDAVKEIESPPAARVRVPFLSALRLPPPARIAASLVVVGLFSWSVYNRSNSVKNPAPDPVQLIAVVVHGESTRLQLPIHQEVSVHLTQYKPLQLERGSRLDIWSDPSAQRFSAKLREDQGRLAYAVWQPEQTRRYRFDKQTQGAVRLPGLASPTNNKKDFGARPFYSIAKGPADFDNIERRFETWVSTREWRPLSMAKDFSLFVNSEGALLQSETYWSGGRRTTVLTATSTHPGNKVAMSLEVDLATGTPLSQVISFESPQQKVALRLVAQRTERLPASLVNVNLFTPDMVIADKIFPRGTQPHESVKVAATALPAPTEAEVANVRANIEYELHRVGACVNDSISVTTNSSDGVKVSGVVDTAARKALLLEALGQLKLQSWVHFEIDTLDEAAESRNSVVSPAAIGLPTHQELLPLTATLHQPPVAKDSLPLDQYLNEYFSQHELPSLIQSASTKRNPPQNARARTALFSSALVAYSQRAHRDSWAIRRLANSFPNPNILNPRSAWQLKTMLQDHARELGQTVQTLEWVLRPVFGPDKTPETAANSSIGTNVVSWPAAADAVFRQADQMNKTLFELFAAGVVAPADSSKTPSALATMSHLMEIVPELERNIHHTEGLEFDQDFKKHAGLTAEQE